MSIGSKTALKGDSGSDSPGSRAAPLLLPTGHVISAEGLFTKAEREKLNKLLNKVDRLGQAQAQPLRWVNSARYSVTKVVAYH